MSDEPRSTKQDEDDPEVEAHVRVRMNQDEGDDEPEVEAHMRAPGAPTEMKGRRASAAPSEFRGKKTT